MRYSLSGFMTSLLVNATGKLSFEEGYEIKILSSNIFIYHDELVSDVK